MVSATFATLFSFAVAFLSHSVVSFTIFRFLAGAFIHGSIPISLVYALEFVHSEYRAFATGFGFALFDLGIASLSLVAYFFTDWRMMAMAIGLLPVPFIFMFFAIPESIQFLYSR